MWSIGFRNGVISSTKDSSKKEAFLSHMAPDYDVGFREGYCYALYKMSSLPKEEPKPEPVEPITVGYVVQDYDFTFRGLNDSSLGTRYNAIAYRVYPKKTSHDSETTKTLRKEEEKILTMMVYLRKHSRT